MRNHHNAKRILLCGFLIGLGWTINGKFAFPQLRTDMFERISVENGLSSNRIFRIMQDREGFYWISTEDGLNRFDGSSFKIFRNIKSDSTSLSHNLCNQILEGDDGDIWIGTMRGVCRYMKKRGIFKRYTFYHPDKNEDILNRISGLAKDGEGNIWITSYGLWKINPVNQLVTGYWFNDNDINTISDPSQTDNLYRDKINNGFWFNTSESINFFDQKTGRFYHERNNPGNWPVFRMKNEEFFYGVDSAGYKYFYNTENKRLFRFRYNEEKYDSIHITFKNGVSDLAIFGEGELVFKFQSAPSIIYDWMTRQSDTMPYSRYASTSPYSALINRVYLDDLGNKWFCTANGLYVVKKPGNLIQKFKLDERDNVFPHVIWSIAVSGDHRLWLGTKTGLFRFNHEDRKIVREFPSILKEPIRTLYNAGDSMLWVGSIHGKVFVFDLKSNRISSQINLQSNPYFIKGDKYQRIWIGTWNNGLFELEGNGKVVRHYTTADGLSYNGLLCSWYDGADELWLGLNGGKGFSKLNLDTKRFENFSINCENNSMIESNTINAVIRDSSENLWLGTYGGGIFFYDRQQKHFENYSRSDGLSADFINTLALDQSGNLWVSTSKGIDLIESKSRRIVRINDDMQFDDHGYINNLLVARDGNFFYTSNNMVSRIDPVKYSSTNKEVRLIRSSFKVVNEEIPGLINATNISLPYNKNFFTIEYSVLKESPSIPAQYAYKLEGLDADWKQIGNRGYVNYTSIPPGKYTLLMNATNEFGKWNNKPLSVTISIDPPFWKTWWFFVALAMLISGFVIYIVNHRVQEVKKRQQERVRLVVATQEKEQKNIAGELHDHLGVRLSALKFFLTSLKNHLATNEHQVKETYQRAMATIDESVEDVRYLLINLSPKTLNEYGYLKAVEDLVNKLGKLHSININLQQNGLEERLHTDIEAGLYRITQELINNTLKHANAKNISLSIEKKNGMLKLFYEDDGIGFNPYSKSNGYGLENIHTRVALLHGKIEWNTAVGKFSKVTISVPTIHTKV
jgi:signal transduction histidine kinase/ligand-binding sensor domain-containing protein